jgi:hypothetical protein
MAGSTLSRVSATSSSFDVDRGLSGMRGGRDTFDRHGGETDRAELLKHGVIDGGLQRRTASAAAEQGQRGFVGGRC